MKQHKTTVVVGLDVGSVSVKVVALDSEGSILDSRYLRHQGRPLPAVLELLRDWKEPLPLAVTGTGGGIVHELLGVPAVNEVVAHGTAAAHLVPGARSVIEMGGEDSKFISLQDGRIVDFSMNALCAAGTGSFLDQQAERLRLSIEEFGRCALKSKNPPRIAGRCSVFAKSDMIHLQQIATPVEEVVAGLCFAVARNFKSAICRGRVPEPPVVFQGGLAANPGMVRAFREVFGIENLIVPKEHLVMGALGAALVVFGESEEARVGVVRGDLSLLRRYLASNVYLEDVGMKPLLESLEGFHERHAGGNGAASGKALGVVDVTLGIDIGSISTNLAVVDRKGRLLAKRYLMTAGRPIEAVRQGLGEIARELGSVRVLGVGTTGSGRYMIADFVGADVVKNEITAQAAAAVAIDPTVESIIEIGGQDSKYIALKNGAVVDFEMNKACAAGTGSFLEEQAERLDLSVKNEFADLAFRSGKPCSLGERCTVFMENNIRSRQQQGAPIGDLVAGLAYSIVKNYLNRVVGDRQIGSKVFFQGGTAFNKAVVAAFEQVLGREITVPPDHDVTGAIGMARIAAAFMEEQGSPPSRFKGFDLSTRDYSVKSFECKGCSNVCEINRVSIAGEKQALFYGGRCEKYDKKSRVDHNIPDLFQEREQLLLAAAGAGEGEPGDKVRGTIGIPRIFFMQEFLPLWSRWLRALGFRVVVSPPTDTSVVRSGIEAVLAEACFPVKVAHGHIRYLAQAKDVDAIWLPSYVNLANGNGSLGKTTACPYTQTIPYVSRAALGEFPSLVPIVDMENKGEEGLIKEVYRVLKPFGVKRKEVKLTYEIARTAQEGFRQAVTRRGREILEGHNGRAVVIVGRAYNAFDPAMNLSLHKKMTDLGVLPLPMDFLPLDEVGLDTVWPNMYWRSGQRIMAAAEIIREDPRLNAVFITNFSCGPDSFVLRFFKERMGGAPFLQIEIDEHSADAGAITRCEAFLDSVKNSDSEPRKPRPFTSGVLPARNGERIVFIPRMSDHTFAVAAAFQACGVYAEVLPESNVAATELGRRFVSGKECYPCAVTTGDMVAKASSADFVPSRSAFFMPSGGGPCRFGQYNVLHRIVLDDLGFPEVPILSPMQEASFYDELGGIDDRFARLAFEGIAAVDMLTKCVHETRPYERSKGEADQLYGHYLSEVGKTIRGGNGAMPGLMKKMKQEFSAAVGRAGRDRKPRIGIVGEIFVRSNRFSNENLVRRIEEFGGEVWLSPITEWIFYINRMGLRQAKKRGQWKQVVRLSVEHQVQEKIEREFTKPFGDFLETGREADTHDLLEMAGNYLHDSFEGEAILSIGKAVDCFKRDCAGVVSAMPFGCMPGTIVSALLKAVKEDFGGPTLSIAFDGSPSSGGGLQLETFMHQARDYASRRTKH